MIRNIGTWNRLVFWVKFSKIVQKFIQFQIQQKWIFPGESATAIRDPAFYRWHAFIDDLFQIHKEKLRPYNETEIGYEPIRISSIDVQTAGETSKNLFKTFWQHSDVDLSRGIDFLPRGGVYARYF